MSQKYPGLGLPLRHYPRDEEIYPMGAHGNCRGGSSDILPVREVAMMIIMDKLTDKDNWEKKVFDEKIIVKWRQEALDYSDELFWKQATTGKVQNRWAAQQGDVDFGSRNLPQLEGIMTNEVFDYCVQELQNKARYYETSGLIPTLNACATVVKSDKLVSSELQDELQKAFEKLKADQIASPDWHPNSDDMVQDLIHPSMYPLVYGRSRVFRDEVVGVEDAIDKWAGKGEVIQKDTYQPGPNDHFGSGVGGSDVPTSFWSDTYQWLPSNAAFQPDGKIKFTSYINNLHPNKYPDIYRTIEKLIDRAIPAWDQCLAPVEGYGDKEGAGITESRFSQPANPDDSNPENWDPPESEQPQPKDSENPTDPEAESDHEDDDDEFENKEERMWHKIRKAVQPLPEPFKGDEDGSNYYALEETRRLAVKFKDSGLQIIVKMASIELTPEKPEFPVGGWHVEGQMNEQICATVLYYLDSSNVTTNDLSFRMQTSAYLDDDYAIGQDAYHWMERIYGTGLGQGNSPCLQNYGSVETREGRLLAFPNVFQHRVSPFRLIDPSKPGHRRFIALWLVDPHTRIISTANVPPQQLSWWAQATFSKAVDTSKLPVELAQLLEQKGVGQMRNETGKLPPEVREMVRKYFDGDGDALEMGDVEAREHRENIMSARGAFHDEADDGWHEHSYSFCEH